MKKVEPYFSVKPWAGDYLQKFFQSDLQGIGEAWLLSTLPEGESVIDGSPLSVYLGKKLNYLVKVIDAREPLSVQVHPNDEWALQLEHARGKTECWFILDVTPGAGIYLGLKEGVSEEDLVLAISKNKDVDKLLTFIPVERGDFIAVPAGTIHAIGGGVTLMEVQQASGITYRLWDWGRQGRELHIEKGMKVSNFQADYQVKRNVLASMKAGLLLKHPDFECRLNQSEGDGWFIDLSTFEVYFGAKSHSREYLFVK